MRVVMMRCRQQCFHYDKNKDWFNTVAKLASINGEARDAKWLNYKGQKILVVARNNN
jgi:hypothetical protein